jgi:hypothetical protein
MYDLRRFPAPLVLLAEQVIEAGRHACVIDFGSGFVVWHRRDRRQSDCERRREGFLRVDHRILALEVGDGSEDHPLQRLRLVGDGPQDSQLKVELVDRAEQGIHLGLRGRKQPTGRRLAERAFKDAVAPTSGVVKVLAAVRHSDYPQRRGAQRAVASEGAHPFAYGRREGRSVYLCEVLIAVLTLSTNGCGGSVRVDRVRWVIAVRRIGDGRWSIW